MNLLVISRRMKEHMGEESKKKKNIALKSIKVDSENEEVSVKMMSPTQQVSINFLLKGDYSWKVWFILAIISLNLKYQ